MRAFASHFIDFAANFKDNHVDDVRNYSALMKFERSKMEANKKINERPSESRIKPMLTILFANKKETHLVARQILTIVFVKNFSESTTDEDLNKIFYGFGPITSVVVIRDADGKAKELHIYQNHMTPLQLLCCQVEEI
ncbi:hypothetical protein GQ457_06G012700 [Hibiscus cannabinus]